MKNKLFTLSIFGLAFLLVPSVAYAHCPLCTAGAGGAALLASWLGVSSWSIGIFIGAFAVATGLWFSRLLKKKINFSFQDEIFAVASFILTVWPLRMMLSAYDSFYLYLGGEYGSWYNKTYMYDTFIVGSLIGGFILFLAPMASNYLTKKRSGKMFQFQGMIITFASLFITSILIEIYLWTR